jgi:hypothetical protein
MSKTLGDRIVNFYEDYIAVSKKSISKKEKKLTDPKEYDPVLQKGGYIKLTPEKRRKIALESPLLMKGIKKKSMDTFRAWFEIITEDGKGTPVKADLDAFRDFEVRNNFKKKMYEARVCAHIYGDGYLLITFTNDGDKTLSDPVDELSEPYEIQVLNPENIPEMEKKDGQVYYKYEHILLLHTFSF